jgi:hypothetical protein
MLSSVRTETTPKTGGGRNQENIKATPHEVACASYREADF